MQAATGFNAPAPILVIYDVCIATLRLVGIGALNVGIGIAWHMMFNVGVGVICLCAALYAYGYE